jgi:hypothetical protein
MGFLAIVFPESIPGKASKSEGHLAGPAEELMFFMMETPREGLRPVFHFPGFRAGGKQPSGDKITACTARYLKHRQCQRVGNKSRVKILRLVPNLTEFGAISPG